MTRNVTCARLLAALAAARAAFVTAYQARPVPPRHPSARDHQDEHDELGWGILMACDADWSRFDAYVNPRRDLAVALFGWLCWSPA